jgi:hypothetical protein
MRYISLIIILLVFVAASDGRLGRTSTGTVTITLTIPPRIEQNPNTQEWTPSNWDNYDVEWYKKVNREWVPVPDNQMGTSGTYMKLILPQ